MGFFGGGKCVSGFLWKYYRAQMDLRMPFVSLIVRFLAPDIFPGSTWWGGIAVRPMPCLAFPHAVGGAIKFDGHVGGCSSNTYQYGLFLALK